MERQGNREQGDTGRGGGKEQEGAFIKLEGNGYSFLVLTTHSFKINFPFAIFPIYFAILGKYLHFL